MFCVTCGKELPPEASVCPTCGVSSRPTARPATQSVDPAAVAAATGGVLKAVFADPVAGVPTAFRQLDRRRALEVGIACAIIGALLVVVGFYLTLPSFLRHELKTIFGLLLLGAAMFASLAGAGYLARKVFHGIGCVEGDVFVASVSLLPVALLTFFAGVVGVANMEVIALAAIFAFTWTVLMLFAGVTRVSGIPENRGPYAVPLMLIISLWLTSIVFRAML